MSNPHGSFIWYELTTTDTAAAGRFYADVIGWRVGEPMGPDLDYQIFSAGEEGVAGMMAIAAGTAKRPGWVGYIGVDDVDAVAAGITAAGGAVHMPATDLAGVGRMAMVADPQGAVFYVMRGVSDESSPSFSPTAVGHCAWNELATSDLAAAIAFYTAGFGWTKGDVMRMGEMGDYQFINHGGQMIGAMMKGPAGAPPAWSFYVRVDDIDAAAKRITDGGGNVGQGPMQIPGDEYAVVATDPQGATFGLVGKRI